MFVRSNKSYILGLALIFLTSCSLEANVSSLAESLPSFFKTTTIEITPASSQNDYSTRGFKIQGSVSYQDTDSMVITTRGFKAYTNVQGNIFKE